MDLGLPPLEILTMKEEKRKKRECVSAALRGLVLWREHPIFEGL